MNLYSPVTRFYIINVNPTIRNSLRRHRSVLHALCLSCLKNMSNVHIQNVICISTLILFIAKNGHPLTMSIRDDSLIWIEIISLNGLAIRLNEAGSFIIIIFFPHHALFLTLVSMETGQSDCLQTNSKARSF